MEKMRDGNAGFFALNSFSYLNENTASSVIKPGSESYVVK